MTDSTPPSPQDDPTDNPDVIPKHTTPTWETELLLSGASVFGLMQVPAWIDGLADRLDLQLPVAWHGVALIASLYAHAAVYGLIVTFLLHLATRAYWIALVGLHSVFPGGIRWDRTRDGPITRARHKELYSDPDALIEGADNTSTLVFATGIAIVMLSLVGAAIIVPVIVLAGVMQTWIWPLADSSRWFTWLMVTCIAVLVVPQMIDRWFGARIEPRSGAVARALKWMVRRVGALGGNRSFNPLMLTVTTNMRHRQGFLVYLGLLYLLMIAVSAAEVQRRNPEAFAWSDLLPASLQERQNANSYESSTTSTALVPRIESDIVTGPYVRLWVPLDPKRMHTFIAACGAHKPTASGHDDATRAAQERAFAICVGDVFAPRLDGAPISGLSWRFFRDDQRGVDGLHAYIPAQQLAAGEHELVISKPARDDNDSDDITRTWRIPFWR